MVGEYNKGRVLKVSFSNLRSLMKNILVVDDEVDILETIVDSLDIEFGDLITIHQATNGIEALHIFKDGSLFDLVVTDLNMPDMDGLELTQNLIKIKPTSKIIVFTGHGDIEEKEKLNALGVVSMIKKPYVEDLVDEVDHYIR